MQKSTRVGYKILQNVIKAIKNSPCIFMAYLSSSLLWHNSPAKKINS